LQALQGWNTLTKRKALKDEGRRATAVSLLPFAILPARIERRIKQ